MDDISAELKQLIKNRSIPADKNTIYKMLVDGMYTECNGVLDEKTLSNMKNDAINIIINIVKYSFSTGIIEGFKEGLMVSKSGVPLIQRKSEKEGQRKFSQKGGLKNSSIYNTQRKEAEKVYKTFSMKYPELVEMYKNNPRKNEPKTMLKEALKTATGLLDRTMSNWAKILLENDGIFQTRKQAAADVQL